MCGIAGFCHFPDRWEKNIGRMNAQMRDRGPDSVGIWHDQGCQVIFGHTRLAVIDLSSNGKQPMQSESGRYTIVLNGEIYNYHHLKQSIDIRGLHGTSDTEILLAYIDKFGIRKALEDAEGMFAFGVYDAQEKNVYLARDRMGEKPLYYSRAGTGLIFASHLNALMSHEILQRKIDIRILNFFFTHKYIPAPWTVYEDVYKLEPGMMLQYGLTSRNILYERYWNLEEAACTGKNTPPVSYQDAVDQLDCLLVQSVKKQMTADVPLGAFLSGGIDSALIAAIMQSQSENRIRTFTIGFPKRNFDEAEYAKQTAKYLGTDHHELYVSEKQLLDVIPRLAGIYGEPFGDTSAICTYLVSELAGQHVTAALSGDGGDELFCGYHSYKKTNDLWNISKRFPQILKKIINQIPANKPSWETGHKIKILAGAESITKLSEELHYRNPFVNQFSLSQTRAAARKSAYIGRELYHGIEDLMIMDMLTYLPDDILTKVDRAAMACSLETRIPLLDRTIVEYAISLPLEYKWDGITQKKILKDVLYRYIPKEFMERPKHGFEVPVQNWLVNGELNRWAEELLLYGEKSCGEYLDFTYIKIVWDNFRRKRRWIENIWYVLMFLQWHRERFQNAGW